ncbi:ethanolamine ammonia-lyase reactivating factor EutA [Marinobacter sp. ANT_B65]|uniref:ethanolamine ammonia-lyase reactivating factor EutA n=1 Tax=Marinobacter sp. ANT_B65 TaxID=2039467 RepID=UPI000BBE16F7|nr:ethanolamine ammonia-lyase reactivating factor EutA [Marinobacter sp. ANT_B65]PCM45598.1 ethanolamine utilization protein EutA [Marinobacter sp. ANT_B65]
MNRKTVHSVGIDIGTTTTQVIFSRLTMVNRAPVTQVPRYEFVEREIFFQSPVSATPLQEDGTVNVPMLQQFIDEQFAAAGIALSDIETGAIIITGETSKVKNAKDTVMGLAERLGDFVVATAGPNLESVIAGRGSGAGDYSKQNHARVLNIDIGGGTSNYVVFDSGRVEDTACLNIGGNLIKTDLSGSVTRVREPARLVIESLFGEALPESRLNADQLKKTVDCMAQLVVDVIVGNHSELSQKLMMTPYLKETGEFDAVFISGGVGTSYYRLKTEGIDPFKWNDIGVLLGGALLKHPTLAAMKVREPAQTQQATVIGAGAYSMSLSGSSIWLNADSLPIRNIPVVEPQIDWQEGDQPPVCQQIVEAAERMDLRLQEDSYAIALGRDMPMSYRAVSHTAKEIAEYYHQHGNRQATAVIVTENDLGKVLGMELQPLIDPQKLLVIDEVRAVTGDYIDIGESFFGGEVVPLTIKSLAFPA